MISGFRLFAKDDLVKTAKLWNMDGSDLTDAHYLRLHTTHVAILTFSVLDASLNRSISVRPVHGSLYQERAEMKRKLEALAPSSATTEPQEAQLRRGLDQSLRIRKELAWAHRKTLKPHIETT